MNNLGGDGVSNNLLLNLNMNRKDNKDVHNIALNQSDDNYTKQKLESDYSSQKKKETEDILYQNGLNILLFVLKQLKHTSNIIINQDIQNLILFFRYEQIYSMDRRNTYKK